MCPGPIFVTIGEDTIDAFAVLAGALSGAAAFVIWYERVQRAFALPPLGQTR